MHVSTESSSPLNSANSKFYHNFKETILLQGGLFFNLLLVISWPRFVKYFDLRSIFEDRFLFEDGVYWTYTTDEKRNIDRKDSQKLPEKIVERITSSMNLSYHLVYVVPEFVNADFLFGRYEDARGLFLCYPTVFQLFQAPVVLTLRLK